METQPTSPTSLQENELKQAEKALENTEGKPNNPEEPMNFDTELQNLDVQSGAAKGQLSQKLAAYEEWKSKLDTLRSDLGLPLQNEEYLGQKSIDDVRSEINRLQEEKENAESGKEMNELLATLGALPATEINIIITTGKTSDGKEITGKNGKKIKPGTLQKLLELAYQGAKKLTIAGFKSLISGLKGVAGGIYEVEKK